MKSSLLYFSPVLLLTFICIVACQAQSDTIFNKQAFIEEIKADPALKNVHDLHTQRKELIALGQVDLKATSDAMDASSTTDPCTTDADFSQIKGGAEYCRLLCEYGKAKMALFQKYPDLDKLTRPERVELLYAKRSALDQQQIEKLILERNNH